jgi:hypothetical protein
MFSQFPVKKEEVNKGKQFESTPTPATWQQHTYLRYK